MEIKREMRAVEGEIVLECELENATEWTGNWLQPRPEQTVMHDEQIDPVLHRHLQRAGGGIDRRADFCHLAGVLDLETVQGVGIIFDLGQPQHLIGITNDFGKRAHPAIVQVPGGIEGKKNSSTWRRLVRDRTQP